MTTDDHDAEQDELDAIRHAMRGATDKLVRPGDFANQLLGALYAHRTGVRELHVAEREKLRGMRRSLELAPITANVREVAHRIRERALAREALRCVDRDPVRALDLTDEAARMRQERART